MAVRDGDAVAVDGAKLEEGIDLLQRDQVDREGLEDLLEAEVYPAQRGEIDVPFAEDDPDVEIRTRRLDRLTGEESPAVVGAGAE